MIWTDGSDKTKWSSGYRIDWTPIYKDISSPETNVELLKEENQ